MPTEMFRVHQALARAGLPGRHVTTRRKSRPKSPSSRRRSASPSSARGKKKTKTVRFDDKVTKRRGGSK